MTNQEILQKINEWQDAGFAPPMTCATEGCDGLLCPQEHEGAVILRCPVCDYVQLTIPEPVLVANIPVMREALKQQFGSKINLPPTPEPQPYLQIKQEIRGKTVDFVESLEARYSKWVSDEFLVEYLVERLRTVVSLGIPLQLDKLAYIEGMQLFEGLLEIKLHAGEDGRQVALAYAAYFEDRLIIIKPEPK